MKVLIGADHRGYHLKERLKPWLQSLGHQVIDVGNQKLDPHDDYPVISFELAEQTLAAGPAARGIICCGSGVGAAVAANKVAGIICGLGFKKAQVVSARHDDDMNVLALAGDYITEDTAQELVTAFLETPVSDEARHHRRIEQIRQKEQQ